MEQVDFDKISIVVGFGGKIIRGIIEFFGVEVVDVIDDGFVSFFLWKIIFIKVYFEYC